MPADLTVDARGLHLSADTALLFHRQDVEQTLLEGRGLRARRPEGSGHEGPLASPFSLDLLGHFLFAPLTAEDYALALELATTPEAVRVIHAQMSALEVQLSRLQAQPLEVVHGWLRMDGALSELQVVSGGQWYRWHHALGVQRVWWAQEADGPGPAVRELGRRPCPPLAG
ncbi:hypothetical protein Deipr_2513 (plasmid) [Deinococcus proteolyticus MRP]|uniref:Uncharacterized protein n=1 Tax=Deinococcus proteolyticus (strain ATCC 35074 / DSM 20540 / JCM 6276 / NBRC 101906 / NCIMB 13154 / VKM Ac-1939 / CCM 2703 / MRP) TaxID=693977 RepID=F0RQS1_DEIPM|nr:hypothetical protein [Deinococcus proteolyticus]ADY27630.1 hypothetical protein Deipr_2513 [Deinococcus proteolyticus MRP]